MFATHGYPEKLKSDNGPPFKSHALKEFFTEKGITHHRVTPRWPEANGLAENFMKSVRLPCLVNCLSIPRFLLLHILPGRPACPGGL